jgi:hypothetical protein
MKTLSRPSFRWLALAVFLWPAVTTAPGSAQDRGLSEEVAVVTGYPEILVIKDYDISLQAELEQNRVRLEAAVLIGNTGPVPIDKIDFDLFAREKYYGVRVELADVSALEGEIASPVKFARVTEPSAPSPSEEGSDAHPRITRVVLPAALNTGHDVRLRFRYTITEVDAARRDLNYRIIAALPDGRREACLISDFSWIPQVMTDFGKERQADERDFFPKLTKPTWRMTLVHPSRYASLVVDGRLEKTEKRGDTILSQWSWRAKGLPQLLVGDSERVEVKGPEASVVFLLPKGAYDRQIVETMGRFFLRALGYYVNLFGPLAGNEIHIAASSAGMGGHGAMMAVFLDASTFQAKGTEPGPSESKGFDEVAAHELAHSWWGISVSSYGRGTKFLREAFCNFATFRLAQEFGLDKFGETRAILFYRGIAGNLLFEPTRDNANLAYTKGALVLDMLRQEMGDDVFFKVLADFASRYKDAHATFTDFLSLCNETSRRDWWPFFEQWCYGKGYPIYRLVEFVSTPDGSRWKTAVTVRNDGQGLVTCPLALGMGAQTRMESFRVPEGQKQTFTFSTSARVDRVVIDPNHTAYQGDEAEARMKVLAAGESDNGWLNYWKGIVTWESGRPAESAALISKAIDIFVRALGPGNAHPAFYYSRGLIRLQDGDAQGAREDLKAFVDRCLGLVAERPSKLEGLVGTLAYAGIVSGSPEEHREKFGRVLDAITGQEIALDPELKGWRKWWEANRSNYEIDPRARSLSPAGVK